MKENPSGSQLPAKTNAIESGFKFRHKNLQDTIYVNPDHKLLQCSFPKDFKNSNLTNFCSVTFILTTACCYAVITSKNGLHKLSG